MTKKSMKKCSVVTLGSLLAVALLTGTSFAGGYNYDARNPGGYQDAQDRQYENVTDVITQSGGPDYASQIIYSGQYAKECLWDMPETTKY